MVAPAKEYDAWTLMRRLADREELEAAEIEAAGDVDRAERMLARCAMARAKADVMEKRGTDMLTESQKRQLQTMLRDYTIGQDLADEMYSIAARIQAGEKITWDDIGAVFENAAQEHEIDYGLPMPSFDPNDGAREVIMADGAPLALRLHENLTEQGMALQRRGINVRNSWVKLGDMGFSIIEPPGGKPRLLPEPLAGFRMRKWFDGWCAVASSQMSGDAELKAVEALRKRVNKAQFDQYVITGTFGERSKRSDLHYFFRKGLPTVVISFHETTNGDEPRKPEGRVIATLCHHPMGYIRNTHVGLMVPTDEVIAALLWMRADEHGFWKKSGQWPARDTRSGL